MAKLVPAKLSSGKFLVYEYGVRLDETTTPPAIDQILKARQLYNNIIAEMRETVELMRADTFRRAGAEANAIQKSIDALTEEIRTARTDTTTEDIRCAEAQAERSELSRQLSALLRKTRESCRSEYKEKFFSRIGKKSTCATYQLRCQAVSEGLGWATANAVLDNALMAFKKTFSVGKAPRFAPADKKTKDTLTLQFTAAGGIGMQTLLSGANNDLWLQVPDGCGPRKYGLLKFRLGRAADNKFATGTWQYHRPLPEGASIGRARLVRNKIGKDYRWYLQLQVKTTGPIASNSSGREPLAVIHFGAANDISSDRVAGFADSDDPNAARMIQLPATVEQELRKSAEVQSQRDRLRDALIPNIKSRLTSDIEAIAGELASIRKLSVQYVSPARVHRLCNLLRTHEALPGWLETWRKKDRQLWQTAAHSARRARNQRKDFYRKFAQEVANKYSTIVIDTPVSAPVSRNLSDDLDSPDKGHASGSARVTVAPYEFESALRWASTKFGVALLELSDSETLSVCAACGGEIAGSREELSPLVSCMGCGACFDIKQNAAALRYQIVTPLRKDAVEAFFVQAAEMRYQEEQIGRTR